MMTPRIARTKLVGIAALGIAMMAAALTLAAPPASAATASNGYPYCNNGSSSDPDGDGWGWENSSSCVVKGSRADPGASSGSSGSGTASNGYPYCSSSSSDPDGDGWGWENNKSCVVKSGSSSGGSSGGGSSSGSCPSNSTCGSYSISGLGNRKSQILSAGGNTLDLATAMLESEKMYADYAYGDYKTYDAANFGIFKQNWGMLRVACSRFQGQSSSQWNNGAVLNSNLSADISCLHQSQSHWGTSTWFAGHRNGSTGLSNPNTSDINAYRTAVYWIKSQIESGSGKYNDTRYWVYVRPI